MGEEGKKRAAPAPARRYAVLLCAEDTEHVRRAYGGYAGVFVRLLGGEEDAEEWEVFRAARGELPGGGEDELAGYDGFVVTGSCSDAHGDDEWIRALVELLRRLVAMRKRVLGVCFGHQILCRAIGGKTGRATKGWDIGVTTIQLTCSSNNLFSSLQIPPTLSVIECHRDEVWELPPQAEVMAWSDKTGVEMFRYGDHIMGVQGHPEYTKDILMHLLDRLIQRNLIQSCHAEAAKLSLNAHEPDREAWKRLCKGFLKGQLFL